MPLTVTWSPEGAKPTTVTISDTALEAVEKFRLSQTRVASEVKPGPPGSSDIVTHASVPIYPDVLSLIVAKLTESLIRPAFSAFPPDEIKAQEQAMAKARADYTAAQETVFSTAVAVVEGKA